MRAPKTSAYAPIQSVTASAPAPGATRHSTPKAMERKPASASTHSPLIIFRSRIAATTWATPVTTAQAAMSARSTSAVIPGHMKVRTPATMLTRLSKTIDPQRASPDGPRTVRPRLMTPSRLKAGGTLTVIEGDHGSTFFHPDDADARRAIDCLVTLQARADGNALIGRQLFPLLAQAGVRDVKVSPRMVYVDSSRPEWVEGFTRNTFTAMAEGVREQALAAGLVDAAAWARGVAGLRRAAEPDGVFCYTFFKGVGVR